MSDPRFERYRADWKRTWREHLYALVAEAYAEKQR